MASRRSFKLVFLEENEEYISDVGCVVDVTPSTLLPAGTSFAIGQLVKSGQLRGRLRIGSQAVYLDLENIGEIIKVPFKQMDQVATPTTECIALRVNGLSAIPTVSVGGVTRLFKPISSVAMVFEISVSLHATLLSGTYSVLAALFRCRNDKEERMHYVSSLLANSVVPFDLTSLASHREVLLLPSPMRVVRIKKMLEINGLIQVSRNFIYFQAIPNLGSQRLKRFPLQACSAQLLKYKLRNCGIEFSFPDNKVLFVLFQNVADRDLCLAKAVADSASNLPSLQATTALWVENRISNFDYLMYLNWASGRSLNDIGQYPVFPWTLSNMTSAGPLDLEDPANYRVLSLPIAATNPVKLAQCQERAKQLGPTDTRFLFGSFYSNPAFVLYFLLRRFPECHLRLHGGHFDHSARLFTSMQTSWEAATMELTPEFFSDPHLAKSWLQNPAAMRLIPEVRLPPWARDSPSQFVETMRASLESAHVSAHLNEWIDLVFGVKSRGSEICWAANNLFHPICYLTDVDTDVSRYCAETETSLEVAVLQSQEFGHVPKQLFLLEPHPKRASHAPWQPSGLDWKTAVTKAHTEKLSPPQQRQFEESLPIIKPAVNDSGKLSFKFRQTPLVITNVTDCVFSPDAWALVTAEGYFISSVNQKRWRLCVSGLTCLVKLPNNTFACGDAHGTVYLVSPTEGLGKSSAIHLAGLSCLALLNGRFVASGSKDQTVCVWDRESLEVVNLLDAHTCAVVAVATTGVGILSGDAKGGLAYWRNHGKDVLPAWTSAPLGPGVQTIDVSPDGTRALVVDTTGLTVWDILSGSILWKHAGVYSAVAIDASAFLLICGDSIQSCRFSGNQFKVISEQKSPGVVISRLRRKSNGQCAFLTSTHMVEVISTVAA